MFLISLNVCLGCFHRPSTVSTRWGCTAWLWSRPTPSPRHPWVAFTSVRPSRTSWRATYTPATSSCAPTPVSPTCLSHGRNSQVRVLLGQPVGYQWSINRCTAHTYCIRWEIKMNHCRSRRFCPKQLTILYSFTILYKLYRNMRYIKTKSCLSLVQWA